ncbi:hypothetical protein QJS10_CPA09g00996 [Acorus calamus]|uniref:Uncharacterized protein n=1 Tax=Acorus calamus TaxID=4465 RepID=A0AAV9E6U8_ACOCL|nr:hypothetical protein QJS10_CPA09g00996 [Acorus calamus]
MMNFSEALYFDSRFTLSLRGESGCLPATPTLSRHSLTNSFEEVNHRCYIKYFRNTLAKMIIEDLRLFAERIRRRDAREGVSLGYIGGCTATLMVWFYEHTQLRNPSAYEKVPRFFRWGRTNDKNPLVRFSEQFHLLIADQKQIFSLQSVHKNPPAKPSTPSMPQHGISPLSARNMDLSEALAVVDKVVGDSTAVIQTRRTRRATKKP